MSNNQLEDHYTRKYSAESNTSSIELIQQTDTPSDRFEAVIKFFPQNFKGGRILELGAGNGNVAKTLLNSDLPISQYTLGDISLPRVEGIKKNINDDRVSILRLDAENIPEEHTTYDAIIMVALIEHLIDPLRSLQNIRKLLKPGGFIYIDTPNIAKYTRRVKLLLGQFPSTASTNEGLTTYAGEPADLYDEGHLHYFTYRSLSLMLTQRCEFITIQNHGYSDKRTPLGKNTHNYLANTWPQMFSEIAISAFTPK